MYITHPVKRWSVVLSLITVIASLALGRLLARRVQRRRKLERLHERVQFGQDIVRHIQIRHQCSEEVAYRLIADFVKRHVLPEERASIEDLLVQDREGLLELALSLLQYFPEELDEI